MIHLIPVLFSRNGQVDANILFIYLQNTKFDNNNKFQDDHDFNTSIAIGISSGAMALAAAQLDYKVGFCQCFLNKEVKNELRCAGVETEDYENALLLVGVGKPDINHNWNTVVIDQEIKNTIHTLIKKVNIYRI